MSLFFYMIILFFYSCSIKTGDKEYISYLHDLCNIECEHLKKSNVKFNATDVYNFRSLAFQEVLKNLDRTVIVRYELLYQKLAQMEFLMTDDEKKIYFEDVAKVYTDCCK